MNIDKIVCGLLEGKTVTAEERVAVISTLKHRLDSGEQGDDIPIVMQALGCDYDAACEAVFSGDRQGCLSMLEAAVSN